jgi:hypothetical protein
MSEQKLANRCPKCNINKESDRLYANGQAKPCLCKQCALEIFGETNNEFYGIRRSLKHK